MSVRVSAGQADAGTEPAGIWMPRAFAPGAPEFSACPLRAHRPAALSSRKGRPRLLAVFLLVALFLLVLLTLFALVLFTVLAVAVLHTDTPFRLS